jgi:hypothetical protein
MQRKWQISADIDEDGYSYVDREETAQAMLECEAMLHRLGGVVSVIALRDELPDGTFEPKGLLFAWDSFSPANRRQERAETVVSEPEPAEIA